ncbi:hypothetical protein AV530_010295 [Patagioenas fasciata monilis]|uniref:Immunoglobulin V-set domain-containing protein n=1 Tax=Patagioenas fasciata monilis TaxID=372326 RepID=A0A1V4JVM8_PATFA|nr:hypothetical protein AV530_010295 [Patagioenas fasciata monilis]
MRRFRGAGLAGLAAVLLVASGRAQVQQEPSAETSEGTGISIKCSHPNIQSYDFIFWVSEKIMINRLVLDVLLPNRSRVSDSG